MSHALSVLVSRPRQARVLLSGEKTIASGLPVKPSRSNFSGSLACPRARGTRPVKSMIPSTPATWRLLMAASIVWWRLLSLRRRDGLGGLHGKHDEPPQAWL